MSNNKYYPCGFCGAEYSRLDDRMKCEEICYKKEFRRRQEEERNELAKNQETRYNELISLKSEIESLYEKYDKKATSYCKDFKEYHLPIERFSNDQLLRDLIKTFGV